VKVSRPLLNFLDYYLSRLHVEPETSFVADRPQQAQIHAGFVVGSDPDEVQRFQVTLSVKVYKAAPEQNVPYDVDFSVLGEFWANLPLTTRGVPAPVVNNALILLYGVARGVVGQLTAGAVHDRFVLPAVTFANLVERGAQEKDSNVITAEEHNALTAKTTANVPEEGEPLHPTRPREESEAGQGEMSDAIELVGRFHGVLLSIQEFDNAEVRPRIAVAADHTIEEQCVIGTYLRTLANVRTLVLLKDAGNFQAIAMIARALFELAVDIRLLREVQDAPDRVMAFAQVEKLHAARKMIAEASKSEPSDVHKTFVANNEAEIERKWQQFWPNQKRPRHWSGLDLRSRARLVKAPFDVMYETNYQELSWYVHAGLTGVANLEAAVFPLICGTSYEVAIESYRETLRSVIEQLGLRSTDSLIEKKLEFARVLPFTSGPNEAAELRRELLGY